MGRLSPRRITVDFSQIYLCPKDGCFFGATRSVEISLESESHLYLETVVDVLKIYFSILHYDIMDMALVITIISMGDGFTSS